MYSTQEKNAVLEHLDKTQAELMAAVEGVPVEELNIQPAPDRWSVAGIVEHIAMIDEAVGNRVMGQVLSMPKVPQTGDLKEADATLLQKVADRSYRVTAPDPLQPTGQPLAASLERFRASRKKLADFVAAAPPDLREHSLPHPALGSLDGHQWLLACSGHCARHIEQIHETRKAVAASGA